MEWTFLYLLVFLKIPILFLLWLVWWAIHQSPESSEGSDGGDGGSRRPSPHPHSPLPRLPRRGPHRTPAPASPPRVRAVAGHTRRRVSRVP
jgi:hypothetical protein